MLIVFAGLPGAGKSTLARALATTVRAAYLRIDTIERALRAEAAAWTGPEGYLVACAVAADILRGGVAVVADCVNPLGVTRDAWRAVARDTGASLREVEIVCSDETEHRARLAARAATGGPGWDAVMPMDYEAWDGARVDTAGRDVAACLAEILVLVRRPDPGSLPAGEEEA